MGSAAAEGPLSTRREGLPLKEQERIKLRKVMDTFTRKALEGIPCTYIQEEDGKASLVGASYGLDRTFTGIHLTCLQGTSSELSVTCPLVNIEDVYTVAADGEDCFPPAVLEAVGAKDMERLIMVVYEGGQRETTGEPLRFCILEESVESVQVFMDCLQTLHTYAASKS